MRLEVAYLNSITISYIKSNNMITRCWCKFKSLDILFKSMKFVEIKTITWRDQSNRHDTNRKNCGELYLWLTYWVLREKKI
jgi:hypothetical protein